MKPTLTVLDVASMLQLSKTSIYKYAETGKIQSFKIGSNLRFSEEQIENFLSKNQRLQSKTSSKQVD